MNLLIIICHYAKIIANIKDKINSKKAICDCSVKNNISLLSEIAIDKDTLLINFKDIKSIKNFDIMKCYKVLFDKKGLKNNLGNYTISPIISFIIILCLLFTIKGYYIFKKNIKGIFRRENRRKKNVENINIDIEPIKVEKGKKIKKEIKKNKGRIKWNIYWEQLVKKMIIQN